MRLHSSNDYFAPNEPVVLKYRKTRNAIKLHEHDFTEVMCVVKGNGVQKIGETGYDFLGGSMFLIPGGVGHMISFSSETEYYDVLIRNDAFDLLGFADSELQLQEICKDVVFSYCTGGTYSKMCEILRMAYQEYENQCMGSEDILFSLIRILLIYLVRYRGKSVEEASPKGRREALPQILDYINCHYTESVKLYDVASLYHYSSNSFSKMFKKNFGMTFSEYLHKKRVELAKEQLKLSNNTVSDICHAVGYSNSSEFYRVFQQYTGITPLEYRRKTEANRIRSDLLFQNSQQPTRIENETEK